MQLNITTDYAIRIVYYLALKEETITASELASVLKIPVNYISKITKKLKAAEIVQACEGIKGGYALMKKPEMISLFDIVSSMEVTMKINRCLEPDGFCSRNATDYCNVHKVIIPGLFEPPVRTLRATI
ncbi:RrF2 family transcriptional regulator, partial [[Ruminococcus] lactaris]|uniref:RrF2 family transcriptional regulator n=1 Tax=[Ruminococcus] lactaris TaxID=46228 RepID=UPI003FD76117